MASFVYPFLQNLSYATGQHPIPRMAVQELPLSKRFWIGLGN